MEFALIVAKVLAVYFIISGLFLIFRGRSLPVIMKDFFSHPAIVYLAGLFLIFLGAVLLVRNNVWDGSWRTWITVFGWLALLKGVMYMLFPQVLARFPVAKMRHWFVALGIIVLVAGLYLFQIG